MSEEKDRVVVKNGQRVSENLTQQEADKRANEMRGKLGESAGAPARESKVQVKQNICG
jgi:hypothetical protein